MKEIRCIKNGLKALESRQKFNHTLSTTFIFSICNFQYFVFFPTQNKLWMPLPFFVILSRGRLKGKSIRRGAKMPMYGVKNSNTEGRGASQLWTTVRPKLLWSLIWNLITSKKFYGRLIFLETRQSKACPKTASVWDKMINYRDYPDSTVFAHPGNRTIEKTVLIGDCFTKIRIYDFWNCNTDTKIIPIYLFTV